MEGYVNVTLYDERRAYRLRVVEVIGDVRRVSTGGDWERVYDNWWALRARRDPTTGVLRWGHGVLDAAAMNLLGDAARQLATVVSARATELDRLSDRARRRAQWCAITGRISASRQAATVARDTRARAALARRRAAALMLCSLEPAVATPHPGAALCRAEALRAARVQQQAIALQDDTTPAAGMEAPLWRVASQRAAQLRAAIPALAEDTRTEVSWRSLGDWVAHLRAAGRDPQLAAYLHLCANPRSLGIVAAPHAAPAPSLRAGLFARTRAS